MNETVTSVPETTDAWPWSKIIKHVLLPKPKGAPRAGKKEKLTRVGLAGVFGLVALAIFSGNSLPTCESTESISSVEGIVNDLPIARVQGAKFVSVKDVKELGFNKGSQIRSCEATLITTAGQDNLRYSIVWSNRDEGQYYVEAEVS